MKLGEICSAPCFPSAASFNIPAPGCTANQLRFGGDGGRTYYSVLLTNHDLQTTQPNPKIAIVGLSPASTQIGEFVSVYNETGSYALASQAGAFAGLSREIIAMLNGLGLAQGLGLTFPNPDNFSGHPEVFVTSLVACATLTESGSSTDFDPMNYPSAQRCITQRFLPQMLSPEFARLSHIVVLGDKGWAALSAMRNSHGGSLLLALRRAGKTVMNLPHPSGANRELVNLASLNAADVPTPAEYAEQKWREYLAKPLKPGKSKKPERSYKSTRLTIWNKVNNLRREVERSLKK